jgi:hypothetical protein
VHEPLKPFFDVAPLHAGLPGDAQDGYAFGAKQHDAPPPGQAGPKGRGALPGLKFTTFFISQFDHQGRLTRHKRPSEKRGRSVTPLIGKTPQNNLIYCPPYCGGLY